KMKLNLLIRLNQPTLLLHRECDHIQSIRPSIQPRKRQRSRRRVTRQRKSQKSLKSRKSLKERVVELPHRRADNRRRGNHRGKRHHLPERKRRRKGGANEQIQGRGKDRADRKESEVVREASITLHRRNEAKRERKS